MMRKIRFSNGSKVTNKRNSHTIINTFIVEFTKKHKVMI